MADTRSSSITRQRRATMRPHRVITLRQLRCRSALTLATTTVIAATSAVTKGIAITAQIVVDTVTTAARMAVAITAVTKLI